jgi:hypothetical protein
MNEDLSGEVSRLCELFRPVEVKQHFQLPVFSEKASTRRDDESR